MGEPAANLRIVLVEPRNPLNIGAVARAMSNFGVTRLRLVKPYEVAFKEARSAIRAGYILEAAEVFETLGDALKDCTRVVGSTALGNRDLHLPLHRLEAAAAGVKEELAAGPVALLFGSEKFGLSNEDLSHCHWLLRIPTRPEHGSMNLGQAVAICLYELCRDPEAVRQRFEPPPGASSEDSERITELLIDLLNRSGWIRERTSQSAVLKVRRLVRRMGLPAADTEAWLGILRQILWKVKQ